MTISFSGLTFQIQLLYPGTERFFAGFLTDSPSYTACLRVTQEDLRQAACYCPADASPEFLETVALRRRLADLLLSHDRCLFHSAAMVFREQAYLFAAPSGTGKTTQLTSGGSFIRRRPPSSMETSRSYSSWTQGPL